MMDTLHSGMADDTGAVEKAKFPVPGWAVRAPDGAHVDVLKNNLLLQVRWCSRIMMIAYEQLN